MQIDLRAASYPSLLEAVGLAIIKCHGMEGAIPSVFRAAMRVTPEFQRSIFEAARGLESHLKITTAAIQERAPEYLVRWLEISKRVRGCAGLRGKVAHADMSIYGGGVAVELDDEGVATGVMRRLGPAVASLHKRSAKGNDEISEAEIRKLTRDIDEVTNDIRQLAALLSVRDSEG